MERSPVLVKDELTWMASPLRALLRLAWPIVISMLSHSAMTLVDTLFVSRLGSWALAGVGLGGVTSFILMCFPMGLLGAVKILASQSVGAGQVSKVRCYLGAGLALAAGFAALAIVLGQVGLRVVDEVAATAQTGVAAQTYLQIVILSAFPILLRIALEQTRLATGDSVWPMRVTVFANLCNIALDYYLIIMLDMGVAGAAYATLVANVLGCLALFAVQAREGFDLRETRWHHLGGVWRLGVPSGLQFCLEMGSYATMVVMLTRLSELDAAANQIAIQVIHFGFLPCVAIGEAASVMVGQAVGAGRRDLVLLVTRKAMIPAVLYTLLTMAILLVGGSWISARFTSEPELLRVTTHLLYLAAAFQIADGVNIVFRSVLRGTGDVRYCAWMGILLAWLMTPPLTWLLGYRMGLGAVGGWIGLCLEIYIAAAVFWFRLRGQRWYAAADRSLRELA